MFLIHAVVSIGLDSIGKHAMSYAEFASLHEGVSHQRQQFKALRKDIISSFLQNVNYKSFQKMGLIAPSPQKKGIDPYTAAGQQFILKNLPYSMSAPTISQHCWGPSNKGFNCPSKMPGTCHTGKSHVCVPLKIRKSGNEDIQYIFKGSTDIGWHPRVKQVVITGNGLRAQHCCLESLHLHLRPQHPNPQNHAPGAGRIKWHVVFDCPS